MLNDPSDASIIAAVIALAHSQGMTAIAEGVETPAQYEKIRQMGCDQIQGYLFSPPVPAEAFAQLLCRDLRAIG
jgi:EAL domain-containing protein (putative c-di-GMP-specific phosphodiesterase class I)